jgi:hypothetical protein
MKNLENYYAITIIYRNIAIYSCIINQISYIQQITKQIGNAAHGIEINPAGFYG